ncbi:MAG: NTP transferase domain-containing protein [Steroidobacterales bacterium]
MSTSARIQGLVLAGGTSSRMQRDKAALTYRGRSQLDRVVELVSRHVRPVFVSVRADQAADPTRAQRSLIIDSVPGEGPMVGIRSAFARAPDVAWLVVACDLPFLSDAVVEHLIRARDPNRTATAYRSTHDGLPEPLCAIFEPAAAAGLAAAQAEGRDCPRKFLINADVSLVEAFDPRALDNVNTPEEYRAALSALEIPQP